MSRRSAPPTPPSDPLHAEPWRPPYVRRRPPWKRLRPRWPAVLEHAGLLLVSLAALVSVGWLAGSTARPPSDGFWSALARVLQQPHVAVITAFAALVGMAWCVRRLWLEWLGWRPGPVQVAQLNVPTDIDGVDGTCLGNEFRRRLSRLRLRSPALVPLATPSADFLGVLGSDAADARNPLQSLLNLLRAAKPTHAYEVSASLAKREEFPRYGVTVEVVRLPHEAIPAATFWAATPAAAIVLGADAVTAAILPRTRLCRPPWSGWRRYAMEPRLLHDYERASELMEDRRYDEALHLYYRALERDPMNIDLRLQTGFVLEKLQLYLDALAMYASARVVGRRGRRRVYRRRARREQRASWMVARYRLCALLSGRHLAAQWRRSSAEGPGKTDRDRQREMLRDRLEPVLEQMFEDHGLLADADPGARPSRRRQAGARWCRSEVTSLLDSRAPSRDVREEDASDPPPAREYYELRRLLIAAAERELFTMRRELRRRRIYRVWPRLTLTGLRLGIGLVEQRRCFVAQELGVTNETAPYDDPHYLVEKVRGVSGLAGLASWSEHYNAACIFALPLLVDPTSATAADAARRRRLTQLAIGRLERAMACTDSAVIAGRRQWIVSEDPDLDALRRDQAFKRFELSYLPSPARSPSRPRCVRRWEIASYMDRLLAATAKRWEAEWHARGRALEGPPDVHRMLEWWEDERKAWDLVRSVAFNRRHWGARHDLVQRMETWSERYGFAPLEVPLPEYTAAPSVDSPTQVDKMAEEQIEDRNDRMERIGEILEDALPQRRHARSMLEEMHQLQNELRRCDDQSLPLGARRVAQLCDAHAGLWQRLREWLEESPSGQRAFLDAVERDAKLWRATQLRWSQQRAVRRHVLNPLPLPATGLLLRSTRPPAPRRP